MTEIISEKRQLCEGAYKMNITTPRKSRFDRDLARKLNEGLITLPERNTDGMIYVRSMNMYFSPKRTHLNTKWKDCHIQLSEEGLRMPTPPEFIKFLKYARQYHKNVYDEITEVRAPSRSCWLDDKYLLNGKKMYSHQNTRVDSGSIILGKAKEVKNHEAYQGFSIDDWLTGSTRLGYPES